MYLTKGYEFVLKQCREKGRFIIPAQHSIYYVFCKEQEIQGRIQVAYFPTIRTCSYTNPVVLVLYFGNISYSTTVKHNLADGLVCCVRQKIVIKSNPISFSEYCFVFIY
jgi:hypothetical protein